MTSTLRKGALSRVSVYDASLIAAALAFSLVTLAYPYGRDQGLYHYVGREWLLGELPYRDVMDQKTPLIYLIFGLANLVFGESLWAVRLVELVWVLALGSILSAAATPRGETIAPGVRGTATLTVCLLYFGALGYWDTAQCEVWYVGLAFLSLAQVERSTRARLGPLFAGVSGGLACLAKPPAFLLLLIVVAALAHRLLTEHESGTQDSARARLQRTATGLGLYAAGAALPTLLVLVYFWARDGLADLYDVLVLCNAYYREHEVGQKSLGEVLGHTWGAWLVVYPLSLLSLFSGLTGLLLSARKKSAAGLRRYAIALAFPLFSIVCVVIQGMYFPYHWGALHLSWAVPLVFAVHDLSRFGPGLMGAKVDGTRISAAACLVIAAGYSAATPLASTHYGHITTTLAYLRGEIGPRSFAKHFDIPHFYEWSANAEIGHWLRKNSDPNDLVVSRNFEPAIYAVARRSGDLRFFWTSWLTAPHRAYRRDEWLAQDRAELAARRPRFAVIIANQADGPDSLAYLEPLGTWEERFRVGNLAVVERVGKAAAR